MQPPANYEKRARKLHEQAPKKPQWKRKRGSKVQKRGREQVRAESAKCLPYGGEYTREEREGKTRDHRDAEAERPVVFCIKVKHE